MIDGEAAREAVHLAKPPEDAKPEMGDVMTESGK